MAGVFRPSNRPASGNLGGRPESPAHECRHRGRRGCPAAAPSSNASSRIAHEHVLIWVRDKSMVRGVAARLRVTPEAAVAIAIADQVFEEFRLTFNDSP